MGIYSNKTLRMVKVTRYFVKLLMSDPSALAERVMRFSDKESAMEFVSRMRNECPVILVSIHNETVEEYTYSSPLYDT